MTNKYMIVAALDHPTGVPYYARGSYRFCLERIEAWSAGRGTPGKRDGGAFTDLTDDAYIVIDAREAIDWAEARARKKRGTYAPAPVYAPVDPAPLPTTKRPTDAQIVTRYEELQRDDRLGPKVMKGGGIELGGVAISMVEVQAAWKRESARRWKTRAKPDDRRWVEKHKPLPCQGTFPDDL